jgi:hypothetical protein
MTTQADVVTYNCSDVSGEGLILDRLRIQVNLNLKRYFKIFFIFLVGQKLKFSILGLSIAKITRAFANVREHSKNNLMKWNGVFQFISIGATLIV